MKDHTISLLKECDSGCKMAVNSMDQVLEYEAFKQLNILDETGKEPERVASMFSKFSTDMKMMIKGDDRQVAKIMMDGCNMGIQSISGFKNQYPGASKKSMELADRIVETEEAFMAEMKGYL